MLWLAPVATACAIHYDNYLKVFPLWALGELQHAR